MRSRVWRRASVLAVDDQYANLVTLDAVLSAEFDVIRASSGEQALSILQARGGDIDVILMDAQMPGMDGFETVARIKQLPDCRDIPIVFVTAVYNEDPFIKQGYQVGAVDYFSKPFDPEILRLKVGIYASFHQKADLLKAWARHAKESEELLHVGRRFSAELEHLRVGAIVTDTAGRVRHVSAEAADPRLLGWWDDDGRLLDGGSTPITEALTQGQTVHETCEVRDADGFPRTMLCTASPLRGRDGALAGAVLIVRDATESRRMEHELERRIRRLVSGNNRSHGPPPGGAPAGNR
jgi:CheY-like chemotaxis protein